MPDELYGTSPKEAEQKTKYVGRGRGSADREKVTFETVRYQITSIEKNQEAVAEQSARFGRKASVTEAAADKLSLQDAVLSYRNEYRVEQIFGRLKSRLDIAPLFVRKDDRIEGLTCLLILCVRVMTLIEFVVRRSLKEEKSGLAGMHPENRKKITDRPSAERILKAFSKITLTIICDQAGRAVVRSLKPLTNLQREIIQRLNLDPFVYYGLEN